MMTTMCNLNLYIDEYILYIVKDLCDINGYLQSTSQMLVEGNASTGFRAPTRIEYSAFVEFVAPR